MSRKHLDLTLASKCAWNASTWRTANISAGADLFAAEFPKANPATPGVQPAPLEADFSPDGGLIAVRDPKIGKRIDVWSMAEGKHVVGWLPYEKEGDVRVRWFAFLDAKHLLTLGGVGKLTLWEIPEMQALYSISFVRDVPALSWRRKYLAAFNGSNFEVLEAATGERVGQLFHPNARGVHAAAYRRDGRELAAVLTTAEGFRLVRWDAVTGTVKDDFPLPPGGNDLQWCGPDSILYGATLFDLKLKWPVAYYTLPGMGRGDDFAGRPPLVRRRTRPEQSTSVVGADAAGRGHAPVGGAGQRRQNKSRVGPRHGRPGFGARGGAWCERGRLPSRRRQSSEPALASAGIQNGGGRAVDADHSVSTGATRARNALIRQSAR